MLALVPAMSASDWTGIALVVLFLAVLCGGTESAAPQQRMMRDRRRHAERTARAMRRMTQIRREAIDRMNRAEEEGRQ
jgi:hypothetical protein